MKHALELVSEIEEELQFGNNAMVARNKWSKGLSFRLESATRSVKIAEWRRNARYRQGRIVFLESLTGGGHWAMCMQAHKANKENKPHKDEIFEDLLIEIIPQIESLLIHYVQGFNTMLANIIVNYTYKTSKFWWNGCAKRGCGNLVIGYGGYSCKKCENVKLVTNDANRDCGAVINFDKENGNVIRLIVTEQKEENKTESNEKRCLVFNKNVTSALKKQKICNLLKRNFNKSMENLILNCIKTEKVSIISNTALIEIGNVNIWALYGDKQENELLCALIWRSVAGNIKNKNVLMFETLFLSTYEHVRHKKYGKEMVKQIYNYCISNCYDIICVAAVPNHGVSFWANNGFKMKYEAPNSNSEEPAKKSGRTDWETFMKNNMVLFDDTPLYAKFLT